MVILRQTLLEVSEREEGVVALQLTIAPLGWSQYWDTNPVPSSPLADDIATAPSGALS